MIFAVKVAVTTSQLTIFGHNKSDILPYRFPPRGFVLPKLKINGFHRLSIRALEYVSVNRAENTDFSVLPFFEIRARRLWSTRRKSLLDLKSVQALCSLRSMSSNRFPCTLMRMSRCTQRTHSHSRYRTIHYRCLYTCSGRLKRNR